MLLELILNNLLKDSDKYEVTILKPMEKPMNKTQRVIQLFYSISNAHKRTLHYEQIMPILSKTKSPLTDKNALKFLNELLEGSAELPPILIKLGEGDKNKCSYKLNNEVWENFVLATNEGRFYFEAFKQLGGIIESNDIHQSFEYVQNSGAIKNLGRKFLYLSKVQAKEHNHKNKYALDLIVQSLIEERLLQIQYIASANLSGCVSGNIETQWRDIKPLTLCQYRDDLYLLCHKVENTKWVFRTYKLSRIQNIKLSAKQFSYPDHLEWNPVERYENASGLVLGEIKKCTVRVFGHSRQVFEEKLIFNSIKISNQKEYSDYELTYTGLNEFVGQLFVYAQDIEIIEGREVKDSFVKKAKQALQRNQTVKDLKKAS